jgi:Ca2+-binding RTX toxin-like protein
MISSLEVNLAGAASGVNGARYSISNHTVFDINDLYADALDNGQLDTIPALIFSGVDEIIGSQFADVLFGFDSADVLKGNEGNDELNGGENDDNLTGGLGADRLTGGPGADTFHFLTLKDSTKKAIGRDTILDFSRAEGDKIDLEPIDALKGDGTSESKFKFIGKQKFSDVNTKNKGELRYVVKNGDALVQGDIDKDNKPEFAILLEDVTKLKATDFFL